MTQKGLNEKKKSKMLQSFCERERNVEEGGGKEEQEETFRNWTVCVCLCVSDQRKTVMNFISTTGAREGF